MEGWEQGRDSRLGGPRSAASWALANGPRSRACTRMEGVDCRSSWSPPEAAASHDSDGPFEEAACLKLGLHTRKKKKGKEEEKKEPDYFPCLALEMLRDA